MPVGFDLLEHSRALQLHWLRRTAAFTVDLVLVLFPVWFTFRWFGLDHPLVLGIASGLAFFHYCAVLEWKWGATLGKRALGLRVVQGPNPVPWGAAVVRSLPKVFWYVFPPLEIVLALASEGDPRQRLSDRAAGTTVVQDDLFHVEQVAASPVGAGGPLREERPVCRSCGGVVADAGQGFGRCTVCGAVQ